MVNTNHSLSFIHFPCQICDTHNQQPDEKAAKVEHQHQHDEAEQDENRPKNTVTVATWSSIETGSEPNQEQIMMTTDVTTHCVVIIGELSVGKSALCRKFFSNGRNQPTATSRHRHHNNNGHRGSYSGHGGPRRRSVIHLASDDREALNDYEETLEEDGANHHIYERPVNVGSSSSRLRILDINTERHLIDCCHDDQFANVKSYIDIGNAFIIAYAVTDAGTFETAKEILEKIVSIVTVPVILVGNKCDLVRKRQVTLAEGIELAEEHGVKFVETSANLNLNIDKLFEGAIKQIRLRQNNHLNVNGYDLNKKRKSKVSLGSLNMNDNLSIARADSVRNSLMSGGSSSGSSDYTGSRRSTQSSASMSATTSAHVFTAKQELPKRSKSFFKRCKSKLRKTLTGTSKKCQDLSVL